MMTPDNKAGRYTEELMARIRIKLPYDELPSHQYNRIYESIYDWLSEFDLEELDITTK